MSISEARVIKIEPLESKDARWLKLNRIHYLDPSHHPRTYESATRTTRPTHTSIDSIGIVAIIERPLSSPATLTPHSSAPTPPKTTPHILLQKQFRPAIGKVCIETPAGLIDESDATPLDAAIRELKEETGYTAHPATFPNPTSHLDPHTTTTTPTPDSTNKDQQTNDFTLTPTLYNDPGITNTSTVMVHTTISPSDVANQNPQPRLDQGEFLENFEVPLRDLWRVCKELEAQGFAIDARVGGLAEGIEVARRWGLGG